MKLKMMIFALCLIGTYAQSLFAENSPDIRSVLAESIERHRDKEQSKQVTITDEQLKKCNAEQALDLLSLYEKDNDFSVRLMALQYYFRLAENQPRRHIRQEVTTRLVKTMLDPNSLLSQRSTLLLISFKGEDFIEPSKMQVKKYVLSRAKPSNSMVKLLGVIGANETLPQLEELLIDEYSYRNQINNENELKWYYTIGWSARLSRARLGSNEDIQRCIELVRSEKHGGLGALNLLHDIGYIRQPSAIEFLKSYLFSEERITPIKPHLSGEPIAGYIINILADCVEGFPVPKRERRGYTLEEIGLARKWMNETDWSKKIIR